MTVTTELWARGAAITRSLVPRPRAEHGRSPSVVGGVPPAAIVRCRSVEQVVTGLGIARRSGLRVRVGCAGHGDGGVASRGAGPLVIDLCAVGEVAVDARARTARVGAAASFAAVDAATAAHGLGEPRLVGAEIVTADGLVRRVGPESDPDLFAALLGGGTGLGTVTRVDLALRPRRVGRRPHPGLDVLTAVADRRALTGRERERREIVRRAYDPEGLFAPV
ncbi:FAD-binding protein [Actinomycetospora sp. TBRC 11914]|uniref:FAD-binding protein n=1 Tax=Actinomycetospora sp. TBRC 11914 TaxID=2729387 RepID=UPI00145F1075|nr:FAD-binding protein [Actinomycetospora sp. TBRC 11914]NMO92765.1 FAD-dependent oxidoreductase [Actinomycetospora sp. TBRC 11914]